MFQDGSRLTSLESIDAKSQILSHNWTFGRRRRAIFQHPTRTHRRRLGESATIFSVRRRDRRKTCFSHVSNIHGNGFCIPWGVVGFPPSRFWWCCWHQRIFDRSWEAGESASFQKCWLSGVTLALAWDSDSGGVRDTGTAFPLEAQWCCGSVKTDLLSLSHFFKRVIHVFFFFPKMVLFQIWELYLFLWSSSSWWINWFAKMALVLATLKLHGGFSNSPVQRSPSLLVGSRGGLNGKAGGGPL